MQNIFILSVILAVGVAACTSQQKITDAEAKREQLSQIDTSRFLLKKIYDSPDSMEVSGRAFLRFNLEKGSAGGNGSCNSFGSTLKVDGENVNFTDIFSTKMYCESVQQIENRFLGQLGRVTRYKLQGNRLLLFEKEILLLVLERAG